MRQLSLIMAALFLFLPLTANASLITFEFRYSGANNIDFGFPINNTATARGRITFDDAITPLVGPVNFFGVPAADAEAVLGIKDFFIQVSGAGRGNGWFGIDQIDAWIYGLALGSELGDGIYNPGDDFNFFPVNGGPAPCGFNVLAILAGGCSTASAEEFNANAMILTSFDEVPEPGTLALFGLGLAGLGFARRKKA